MMKERIAKNGIAYILQKIVGACILFWKSGLDSRNRSCIMTITEPTMPLISCANRWDFFIYGVFYLTEMIEMGIKSELDELIEEDAEIEWPQVTLFDFCYL